MYFCAHTFCAAYPFSTLECTYLQKAEAAEESGASALVVVNSDNGDLFPLPAGHELTYEELDDLPVVPTVLVQKR